MTFELSDIPNTTFAQEMLLKLREGLNELRAKRRGVNLKIERLMIELRDLEIQVDRINEKEDAMDDEIQRRKLP